MIVLRPAFLFFGLQNVANVVLSKLHKAFDGLYWIQWYSWADTIIYLFDFRRQLDFVYYLWLDDHALRGKDYHEQEAKSMRWKSNEKTQLHRREQLPTDHPVSENEPGDFFTHF